MTIYYVATNGSDSSNGSATTPWKTISKAMSANLKPGDEIVVRPGTYNEAINITKDGSAAGYITLRSEVPGEALIRPPAGSWNAISVNADYIVVDGFDIGGARGDGIEANNVHHIKILNNKVHDSGESGIQTNWSDFIHIEGNETYNNASAGWFSGISLYQNRNITGAPDDGSFRNIIRNNISHDNVTHSGAHTDGNGIIIDDFQSTQTGGYPNYTFPTLVENNLVYENGGKGIQVTWSDYVTVRNNTAYHNNQDLLNDGTWRGELSNAQSSNNTWVNNIAVSDPTLNRNNTAIDNTSGGDYKNANVIWQDNITYNGTSGQASVKTDGGNAMPSAANGNLLGVDPKFVNAAADNFHLQPGSPAINAGTAQFGLAPHDLDGGARAVGIVDIGAYEISTSGSNGSVIPPSVDPTPPPPPIPADHSYTGTEGNDTLVGGAGNAHYYGLGGNDTLTGGAGADKIDGGSGTDTSSYAGSPAGVHVDLQAGTSSGGDAQGDILTSIENLIGSGYADWLTGNSGNNVLNGAAGADRMQGLAGNDVYVVDNAGDIVDESVAGSSGTDTVQSSISFNLADTVHVLGSVENLTLLGSANINGTGNALNNVLTGNSGNNVLNGAAGADTMRGLAGNDVYFVDNAGDVVDESLAGSSGTDTVQSSISFNLADTVHVLGSVENLTLLGSANINGTGNALSNLLVGNVGNNVLTGAAGNDVLNGVAGNDTLNGGTENDTLNGGFGNDSLTGGAGYDTFLFNTAPNAARTNVDKINDFSSAYDTIQLDHNVFTALTTGTLARGAFYVGAAAHDATDRIIYNPTTGALIYDPDGNAKDGVTGTQFGMLDPGTTLPRSDLVVV